MDSAQKARLRDRAAGSLYGLLVGDALGCPVEGLTAEHAQAFFSDGVAMKVPPRDRWRPCGLHSDDGQMALALLDALAMQEPPAEGLASRLADLRAAPRTEAGTFGVLRGLDGPLREAIDALARHPDHPEGGAEPDAGAAVRMAPLALARRDVAYAELVDEIVDVGRVTHTDTRSLGASAAVFFTVRESLHHDRDGPLLDERQLLAFVRAVEERAAAVDPGMDTSPNVFSRALAGALSKKNEEQEVWLELVRDVASSTAAEPVTATSAYAPASVVTAILLHLTSSSFEEALRRAVLLGGDADTVGALVGQMAGALYGRTGIPDAWLGPLRARATLEDRLEPLLEGREAHPGWSLAELEHGWMEAYREGPSGVAPGLRPPDEPDPSARLGAEVADLEDMFAGTRSGDFRGDRRITKSIDLRLLEEVTEPKARVDAAKQTVEIDVSELRSEVKVRPIPPPPSERPASAGGQLSFFEAASVSPIESEGEGPAASEAPITLVVGDITEQEVDAVVNAANTSLLGGGGVDGAIHRKGGPSILDECQRIRAAQGGCKTGEAVVTGAGRLPARHVIHAVGPRWRGGEKGEKDLLASAYAASLARAREVGARILALPSISTGAYRFPVEEAARIALATLRSEHEAHPEAFDELRMVLFDETTQKAFAKVWPEVLGRPAPLPGGKS